MMIGIGGWGLWCKLMVLVCEIVCLNLKDFMIVVYGGVDVGLLCVVGKVCKVVFGFVLFDVILFELYFCCVCE